MNRRLKWTLIGAVLIAIYSDWAANPDLRFADFKILPLGAAGTGSTAGAWVLRIAFWALLFIAIRVFRNMWLRNRRGAPEGGKDDEKMVEQQALIVEIRLPSGDMGSNDDREGIFGLEDQLITAIEKSGAGEFDGNEFGGGVATLYMYGPNADRLWEAVSNTLFGYSAPEGSFAIKRYGKPGSPEERVPLCESTPTPDRTQ